MRRDNVAVIGIGRVGLPLSLYLAEAGFTVYGVDIDNQLVDKLKRGEMPFIEKGAPQLLRKHIERSFFPTTSYSVISKCGCIVLTLGTPVDENMNPLLTQIDSALDSSKEYLKPGQTLILRSTVSPGTTDYVKMFLDRLPNIKVGENFYLAFCPERIAEGIALEELSEIPQIIGAADGESAKKANKFFARMGVKRLPAVGAVSAELAKLFTNMYRYTSFAIANEFMVIADKYGCDIHKIVNLVNKDYKRGGLAKPGLTGGPCLFKDGFFLINDIPFIDLISTAWKINEALPLFLVNKVKEEMKLGSKKAVVLGAAFKANIDDARESLSFKVKKALEREGAHVSLHDPWVPDYKGDLEKLLAGADLVFVATNHDYYKENLTADKLRRLVKKRCLVCDVWNVFGTDKTVFPISFLNG